MSKIPARRGLSASLERQPQSKLELPHGLCAGDLSKSSIEWHRRGRSSRAGSIQVHHVEHIHRLSANLEIEALSDLECAENRQIHILITRLIEKVTGRVSVHR